MGIRNNQTPQNITPALILGLIGTIIIVAVLAGIFFLFWERSTEAQEVAPEATAIPTLVLEPAAGPADSIITVQGEDWPAGQTVFVYLATPDEPELPAYAVANAVVDQDGQFTTAFLLSAEWGWNEQERIALLVRTGDGRTAAEASYDLTGLEESSTATSVPVDEVAPVEPATEPMPVEPTATSTAVVEPTASPVPTSTPEPVIPTPEPQLPQLTSTTNLNIRSGPGLGYAVIGLLQPGQTAKVTGISTNGNWWQIVIPGTANRSGWVSADYARAVYTDNVPIVYVAPPAPAAPVPAPTPTPVVITDWRGEYYNNLYLSGQPVLVRNDSTIDFNWGTGSPAASVPTDNFSARWTRVLGFSEGTYRFRAVVDDGLRLYIDNALVIDSWHDGSPREVSGERWLSSGDHQVRVEYYEHTGDAQVHGWWEKVAVVSAPEAYEEPDADFDAEPRSGTAPLKVEFDNDTDGDYDDCDWDFGDGHDSDDCNPDHTYNQPGVYTVRLEVDGPAGDDDKTREDYIIVYPAAPALQPPPVVTPPSPPPVPPVPPGGPLPPGPPHGSNPAVPPVLPPAGGARPF